MHTHHSINSRFQWLIIEPQIVYGSFKVCLCGGKEMKQRFVLCLNSEYDQCEWIYDTAMRKSSITNLHLFILIFFFICIFSFLFRSSSFFDACFSISISWSLIF